MLPPHAAAGTLYRYRTRHKMQYTPLDILMAAKAQTWERAAHLASRAQ